MKRLLFFLIQLVMVFAAVFPGYGKGTKSDQQMHNIDSQERVSMDDSGTIPIVPETTEKLFEDSDVIAYADIDNVENKIEKAALVRTNLPVSEIFPEQRCAASLLWILKGDVDLQNRTVPIIKKKSRYYLSEKEKRVLYLKKEGNLFHTIDRFGGEHRLRSALCDIRNLKRDATSGGIVASFQGNDKSLRPTIHVLQGRQKTSLKINDNTWNKFLLKSSRIGEFNICEIPLQKGAYTVLMEIGGDLFSYTRLINDYYACVIIGKYRWWEPLYFEG